MKSRVPEVEFSKNDYSIKCPQCGKPITLRELESTDVCSMCGSYWNRFALSLEYFYDIHSEKLFEMFKEYHKDD